MISHLISPLCRFALVAGVLILPLLAQGDRRGQPLTAAAEEKWTIRWNRSDDFNGTAVDWRKWHKEPEHFSGWKWDNVMNVSVGEGQLKITLRRGEDASKPSFTSGMLKSYAAGTYGYYEARLKGAPLFPGVCPAFWLYSTIDDAVIAPGEVRYSEIDIVELTQRQAHKAGNERTTDHNLHTILSNGKPGRPGRAWRRPHDEAFRESQANEYRAPFDPREDFHIYGCRVGKETIIWYVDGKEVGRKPNLFWHRPMRVALSLGLREPFATFRENRLMANPEATSGVGQFPTSMVVDYVRVWELEEPS